MSKVKALIICGDGINCENETSAAFTSAGAQSKIIHINDIIKNSKMVQDYQILALPGGFSFGDEINSGQILGIKLKYHLMDELKEFIESKRLIIGICNGFQALVKLGLLAHPFEERVLTLAQNESKQFINKWVRVKLNKNSHCIWTQNINGDTFSVPIRHGEGRIVFKDNNDKYYQDLKSNGQVVLTYDANVNGSYKEIAGICDKSGAIFGLMPHPEAANSKNLYPYSEFKLNDAELIGQKIFNNGVRYFQ